MPFERPYSAKSVKAAQLADLIRDLLARYIQKEFQHAIISVTSVTLTPDFSVATAWIRVFPEQETAQVMERLQRMRGLFYSNLRHDITRKNIPELEIKLDTTAEDEQHISDLLN